MATKTTIVAPDNTSITEIFGGHENEFEDNWQNFRGIPMKCGTTKSEWFSIKDDYGRLRPITNVDDGVAKLLWVHRNPEKVNIIKENGYKWVMNLTWDKVCAKWIDIFDKAYKDVEKERKEFELKSAVAKTLSVSKEANANDMG
jgi:glycosyltransferase involved in cell wall biosynthesis